MRGKPAIAAAIACVTRIIPARAGQTSGLFTVPWTSPDHPRACGANDPVRRIADELSGSSPRVRGKHRHHHRHGQPRRIIPARAGQTCLLRCWRCWLPEHPRACGANLITGSIDLGLAGSSPRVRGKRVTFELSRRDMRIIPARTGQT